MRIYEVIYHWFVYKEKEGRHIRKYIMFISPCIEKTAVMKVGKNNIARTSASPTDYHVLSIRINCSQGPLNYLAFQSFDYQRTR